MTVSEHLKNRTRIFWIIISIAMVFIIGLIDFLTMTEISFSIFYIVPIVLTSWFGFAWLGLVLSFVSALLWLLTDLYSGHIYVHPFIPYLNAVVRLGFFLIVNYILIMLKKSLLRERELALIDPLTGVSNSKAFYEFIAHEIQRFLRYRRPFTIAYMDVDAFQNINDNHGHSTGDSVLRLVAATIKNNLRKTDIIARLGGDEFGILLPETGRDVVETVFDRIQKNLIDFLKNIGYPLTFSIGVVTFLVPPSSPDEVLRKADKLMFSVKNSGKNMIKYEVVSGKQINNDRREREVEKK